MITVSKMINKPKVLIKKEHLEKLLLVNNWSKQEFARRIGISNTSLSRYLHSKSSPTPDIRKRMLDSLRVEWDEIFFTQSVLLTNDKE